MAHDPHVLDIGTLADLDPCHLPAAFAAIADHLGMEPEPMFKAVRPKEGEQPDPRYPEIDQLIRAATADWIMAGKKLLIRLDELLQQGTLLPLTGAREQALQDLFRIHGDRFLARFAGQILGAAKSPLSHLETAYRFGRSIDPFVVRKIPVQLPTLQTIIDGAEAQVLSPRDVAALAYVQRRGQVYMRRPIDQSHGALTRVLTEVELEAMRAATQQQVVGGNWKTLARTMRDATAEVARLQTPIPGDARVAAYGASAVSPALREAMAARTLQNDFDRVARTEMHFAASFGAYQSLKQRAADAGRPDPLVYKFVAPSSCSDCRRIWGNPKNPNRWRLSFIEEREAAGGNFGISHADWGPTIGPVHPNCTEGPLQIWDEKLVAAINDVADQVLQAWRR